MSLASQAHADEQVERFDMEHAANSTATPPASAPPLRSEHIHPTNFIRYTDLRDGHERDCDALIIGVHRSSFTLPRFDLLFLDTMEIQKGFPVLTDPDDDIVIRQERARMRATSREKAIANVRTRHQAMHDASPEDAEAYKREAESFGLL